MPKQLYIALPCAAARRAMLQRALGPDGGVRAALSEADMAKIVEKTAGYSGVTPAAGTHADMNTYRVNACSHVRQHKSGASTPAFTDDSSSTSHF